MQLSKFIPRRRQDWHLIAAFVVLVLTAWSTFLILKSLPPDPPYLSVRVVGVQLPIVIFGDVFPIKSYWEVQIGLEPPKEIPIDKVTFEWILFSNTGERAFVWDELVLTPVRVKLTSDEGRILRAEVRQRNDPADHPPYRLEVESGNRAFVISTPVLNPGEQIIVDLIHSGEKNTLAIEGRIKDQEPLTLNRVYPKPSFWKRPAIGEVVGQQYLLTVVFLLVMMVWVHKKMARSWLSSLLDALLTAISGPWIAAVVAFVCLATFLESSKHSQTLLYTHAIASLVLSGLYLRFCDPGLSVRFRFAIRLTDKFADGPNEEHHGC